MKKTLYQKLITIYIFVGIIAFLFATAGGSHFVESYLEDELGDRFYQCAAQLVSDESFLDLMAAKDVSHLFEQTQFNGEIIIPEKLDFRKAKSVNNLLFGCNKAKEIANQLLLPAGIAAEELYDANKTV